MKMNKIKRTFLRIPYLWYRLFNFLSKKEQLVFNKWLIRHGYCRVTNSITDLNIFDPNKFRNFNKKYPKRFIYPSNDYKAKKDKQIK